MGHLIHLAHYESLERTESSKESVSVTACGKIIDNSIVAVLSTKQITCTSCKEHNQHK
jgi:hypothetical protein